MKKMITRKTSAMLLFVMIASALFPVIAFAGAFLTGVTYNTANSTVTGEVYVTQDVYDANPNTITMEVYGSNGVTGAVYATYNRSVTVGQDVYYYYGINSTVVDQTYGTQFQLRYLNSNGLYDSRTFNIHSSNGNGNIGGGGGGGVTPPAGTINVGTDGKVDAAKLTEALKGNGTATINIAGEFVILPASALKGGKSITIVASGASYTLPIDSLNLDELAKSLGVDLADLNITVTIAKLTGDAAKAVSDAVYATGGKSLSASIDFKVTAEGKGKTQEIKNFGTYVSRTITLDETPANVKAVVAVLYNPVTKKLSFVPATTSTVDGKTVATLKRNSNSIYTVMSVEAKSFADLAAGYWAKADVETLATKLIIAGTSADKFEPKRNITRAEFAAIVVRSLGLNASTTASKFTDVSSTAWFASDVATATEAGIISGYKDGTFKPNANITRQELAAIVVRAMKFAGKEVKLTDAQVSSELAAFTDAAKLGWAKAEVAAAVNAGIVQGLSTTKIGGAANANRAEAAAMVLRFLTKVEFIN